ncbi:MAG: D-glycero-D-manno-heptose 1-phosphate guanosyltransferase [Bacteroidetes bacterium]|nr:MAG: D-glycero-D-manno-heptose 1-phosphate guanosyltransferase [Bacteroidota bacterium]
MVKEAIILAGGFGTRLQKVVRDVPKPMAHIAGRPFLEYQLDYLIAQGIRRVIFSLGYLPEVIMSHFGDSYGSLHLCYAIEPEPLGTGGAIAFAAKQVEGEAFWVFNGDSLFEVDLQKMERFHFERHTDFTLALRAVDDVSRYGAVETDEMGIITRFQEKDTVPRKGVINGGIYLVNGASFLGNAPEGKFSVEKTFFMPDDRPLSMAGIVSNGYFIDIGIPEDYQRAQHEFLQR